MIFKNKIIRSGISSLLVMLFLSITAFGQATTMNPGLEGPCTYLNDQVAVSGIDFNAVAPYVQTYAISDPSGNILAFSPTGNFGSVFTGTYDLWAFNYDPTVAGSDPTGASILPQITAILNDPNACIDVGGPFTVDVCDAALFTDDSFCATNTNIAVVQATPGTYNINYTQEYYLVDATGAIVAGPSTNAQFANPGVGNYTVYAVNYDPVMPIIVASQADLDALTVADDCAEVASGPIEVIVCAMCAIMPSPAANIVCDDNGTPSDDTDDTFTFDITVNGSNPAGTGTFNDDQGNAGMAYGTTLSYGPFPISGGNVVVNFTDVDDAMCTGMMMAAVPATCSNLGVTVNITDPCACGSTDNVDTDMDGEFDLFYEEITLTTSPADAAITDWIATFTTGTPLDMTGVATAPMTVNNGDGTYTVSFYLATSDIYSADFASAATGLMGTVSGGGCEPCPDIPTLSEWGLITLALLLMTLGAVKMAVGSVALAGTGSKNLPMPGGNSFRLPFDMAIFRKALNITAILAIIGFAICFAIFGAVFMPDLIGVAIAGPIFAYLAHLLYILETKQI